MFFDDADKATLLFQKGVELIVFSSDGFVKCYALLR